MLLEASTKSQIFVHNKLPPKCKLMQPTRANNTIGRVLHSLRVPALRAYGQEEH